MRNVNQKKIAAKNAPTKPKQERRDAIPAVAAEQEIPAYMIRLARKRHVKISKDQTILEHRHD